MSANGRTPVAHSFTLACDMARPDEITTLLALAQSELRELRREAAMLPPADAMRLLMELERLAEESRQLARVARTMRGH